MKFVVLMIAFGLCSAQSGDWPSSADMEKLMEFGIEFFCDTKDEFKGICEVAKEEGKDHSEDKELIGKMIELGEKCEDAIEDFVKENPGLGKYFEGKEIDAAKDDFEMLKEHYEGMEEKPDRKPKQSPKKFKKAKEAKTAMGEAENMVDMVDDKKRGPKEILQEVHEHCKAVADWEDYAETFSGYESFDEEAFCAEHAPEDPARAVARRMLF